MLVLHFTRREAVRQIDELQHIATNLGRSEIQFINSVLTGNIGPNYGRFHNIAEMVIHICRYLFVGLFPVQLKRVSVAGI